MGRVSEYILILIPFPLYISQSKKENLRCDSNAIPLNLP